MSNKPNNPAKTMDNKIKMTFC